MTANQRHQLELAIRRNSAYFVRGAGLFSVSEKPEAQRFGLPPGRYYITQAGEIQDATNHVGRAVVLA